jgi:hypothetical protein
MVSLELSELGRDGLLKLLGLGTVEEALLLYAVSYLVQ